jgi:hypothetical protein
VLKAGTRFGCRRACRSDTGAYRTKSNGIEHASRLRLVTSSPQTTDMFVANGIRFNDYIFTEPRRLADWAPPKCPGVFVLLSRDPNCAPKPFQPLWFGEFGNNARHDIFGGRQIPLPRTEPLYISVLAIPFSTTAQRTAIRDELIWAYNSVFQASKHHSAPSELQEPESRPRRRQIGFLPSAEPSI